MQVGEVPWKPHVGLRLELNRRPEHVYTKQLIKPKPLPMKKDEKGEFEKWSINDDDWNRLLRDHHDEATSYIKDQCTEDNPAYKHSVLLHIDNKPKGLAERYAAWSLAAEHAMIQANGSDKDREHMSRGKSDMTGRGRMPEYALKSLATKSSDKGIEHCMWQFDSKSEVAGSDLFTTLWTTIASTFDNISDACKHDNEHNNTDNCHEQHANMWHCVKLYSSFFNYIGTAEKSPLVPSLNKLKLESERWTHILLWPLFLTEAESRAYALEARNLSKVCARVARDSATSEFEQKMLESLENGNGWLHKCCKNEKPASPIICAEIKVDNLPRGMNYSNVLQLV